jgi:Spy/CpxP family protein refolding chaperone
MSVAAALGAVGAVSTKAQPAAGPGAARPLRGQLLEKAKEKLSLTEDQVARIKAELGTEKETLKALIGQLHDAKVSLREAIQAAGATEASVRAAAAKVGAAEADLAVERFKLYGRINPILTDDQREKVKQMQSQLDDFLDGAINRLGERWAAPQP